MELLAKKIEERFSKVAEAYIYFSGFSKRKDKGSSEIGKAIEKGEG